MLRGDSHYARTQAMAWCERQRIGYIFGLAGNPVLLRRVGDLAEDAAMGRIDGEADKVRRCGELRYAATSWKTERRVIARVEAGPLIHQDMRDGRTPPARFAGEGGNQLVWQRIKRAIEALQAPATGPSH